MIETDIHTYYDKIQTHGEHKSLGWSGPNSQYSRFRTILKYIDQQHTVLDFGCGYGDLAPFFSVQRYVGYDIRGEAIEIARTHYPEYVFVSNIDNIDQQDWCVASGIFCHINIEDASSSIARLLSMCYDGIVVNFLLSNDRFSTKDGVNFYSIAEISKICLDSKYKFIIDHTYRDNDFTLIVYK